MSKDVLNLPELEAFLIDRFSYTDASAASAARHLSQMPPDLIAQLEALMSERTIDVSSDPPWSFLIEDLRLKPPAALIAIAWLRGDMDRDPDDARQWLASRAQRMGVTVPE